MSRAIRPIRDGAMKDQADGTLAMRAPSRMKLSYWQATPVTRRTGHSSISSGQKCRRNALVETGKQYGSF